MAIPERLVEAQKKLQKECEEQGKSWPETLKALRDLKKKFYQKNEKVIPADAIVNGFPPGFIDGQYNIIILADVYGWAWYHKAKYLAKYLSRDFNIRITIWQLEGCGIPKDYDLYLTFECFAAKQLEEAAKIPIEKIITGATAHTYINFPFHRHMFERVKCIHANSMLLFNELININSRCYYLPNGVNHELFAYNERDLNQEFTIGFVGKDTERKGYYQYVMKACEKAGVKLKSLTCKYNDEGKIAHEKMPKWYHDIDAVMIASDMDGTPGQLLEAASVGRTFIGCEIGNVPEFSNGRNGIIVNRNVDKYAEAIDYLKNNRETCRLMGINARQTIEKGWTWEIQSKNYHKMLRELL